MVRKKYLDDYRLESYLDSGHRVRQRAVYRGEYFCFCSKTARQSATRMLGMVLLTTLTLLPPLLIKCNYGSTMYVLLPLVVTLLPLYFLLAGLRRVYQVQEKATREQRDKIADRIPVSALLLCICTGLSLIGSVVFLFLRTPTATDWLMAGLTVLRGVLVIPVFMLRREFEMKPLGRK